MTLKHKTLATVVAAGLLAGGVTLSNSGIGQVGAASIATHTLTAANTGGAQPAAFARQHGTGNGKGGFRGMARQGRGLTVTKVDTAANTITATGRGGQAVTITVSATTTYSRAGAAIGLGDIHPTDQIAVQGTRTAAGAISATTIEIVLPRVAGVITAASNGTLTVAGFNGASQTVVTNATTTYERAGKTVDASAAATGASIVATGTRSADGSFTALQVTIQEPRVGGQVTTINSDGSFVVKAYGPNAGTKTITATAATSYTKPDGSAATAADIKQGSFIMAEGTLSVDRSSLAADRIVIIPAGAGRGNFGGKHGGTAGAGSPTI